ncbi:(Fe-S)-binding protein [Pollutibacter soli]|uniref:(Fe-S)-binding protein n=1 Tax=Pollutibacter soli TaxID=3034157 RepID=UPI003013DB5C
MKVSLFIPCFMDQLYPDIAFNTVKVLQKAGCTVGYNTNQTCCGQPAYNAGFKAESRAVCEKFLSDFNDSEIIVTPSASCAGFIRNYYNEIFSSSALSWNIQRLTKKVYELSDFLVNILKVENLGASFEGLATYHDSCAGLREYGIKSEPRKLLQHVKRLQLTEMSDVETCCGFGGSFAVKFESISLAMGDQKAGNISATGARYVISTDVSCLMHIQGVIENKNIQVKSLHLADVLASGY